MSIGGSTIETELAALTRWPNPAPAISTQEYADRLEAAQARLDAIGADAMIIHVGHSMRYYTGLSWSPTERLVALLVPRRGKPSVICPAFELGSLEAELAVEAEMLLWEEHEEPTRLIIDALPKGAVLAVDPMLPFAWAQQLGRHAELVSASSVIDAGRMIKSPAELALLSQAKQMTLEVHRRAARILAPGIRASEVKRFIADAHRALGASGYSFCAVQFGQATAFPHGLPGDQALEEDQLVLIDTGCLIEGYNSDITRTYAFGQVPQEMHDIWTIEQEAQAAAFAAVRPGESCESVDAAARKVIERAGLGPDYALPGLPHRTGHGVGLSIHEPAYLVPGDKTELQPGMCFSNEPMIVVPNAFGIRLEDHFHVTETGAQWFSEPQPAIDRPFG